MSITSFLRPRVPTSLVPSHTQPPAPIVVAPSTPAVAAAPSVAEDGFDEAMPDLADNSDNEPDLGSNLANIVKFFKTPLANKFQGLVDGLPGNTNTPECEGEDLLSAFACDPASHDNPHISDEDLWEEVLNPLLKGVLGWGTSLEVEAVVRGKRDGLMGLAPFIEYYVQRRRVNEGLLEGKLAHLMDGMEGFIQKKKACVQSTKSLTYGFDELAIERPFV